jgi:hypothetical protein
MSNLARMAAAKAAADGSSNPSTKPFSKASPSTPAAVPNAEGPARLYELRQMYDTYRKVTAPGRRRNPKRQHRLPAGRRPRGISFLSTAATPVVIGQGSHAKPQDRWP